jgi:hypothetical protein
MLLFSMTWHVTYKLSGCGFLLSSSGYGAGVFSRSRITDLPLPWASFVDRGLALATLSFVGLSAAQLSMTTFSLSVLA